MGGAVPLIFTPISKFAVTRARSTTASALFATVPQVSNRMPPAARRAPGAGPPGPPPPRPAAAQSPGSDQQSPAAASPAASSSVTAASNVTTCKANVAAGIEPLCLTKKVMLLHFSKCSGTTICNLAQQAGCETWKRPRQLRDLTPPTPVGVNCGRHLQQLPNPTLTLTLP